MDRYYYVLCLTNLFAMALCEQTAKEVKKKDTASPIATTLINFDRIIWLRNIQLILLAWQPYIGLILSGKCGKIYLPHQFLQY